MKYEVKDDGLYMVLESGDKVKCCDFKLVASIAEAYLKDEYHDFVSRAEEGGEGVLFDSEEMDDFFHRNLPNDAKAVLDIGCGSGRGVKQVTDAIEPSLLRYNKAKETESHIDIKCVFAEALPYRNKTFDCVFSMRTWHYLRSQLEGFIEVNRVLKPGGIFIFDVVYGKNFPFGGITMDAPSLLGILKELGFDIIEFRNLPIRQDFGYEWGYYGIALIKKTDTDIQCMRKLHLVKDEKTNMYKANNFIISRDAKFL